MFEYRTEPMRNEYGTVYGYTYFVKGGEAAVQWLIREVIGEDRYYGQRDVWDQIEIVCE